jgi:hypothetical protein
MLSSTERRPVYPSPWPSLVISAALAVILPLAWISYRDAHEAWGLRILLAPIYIPLAFGLIWPAFVALQTTVTRSVSSVPSRRAWTALFLFLVAAVCSSPFIVGEYQSLMRDRERARAAALLLPQIQAQREMEKQQIQDAIRENGITAFAEPLTALQADAVERYIDDPSSGPADLQNVSEHYRTSVDIMKHLASKNSCPPQVLETVFENTLALQRDPANPHRGEVFFILNGMAWNPNVSVPLLTKMLENEDSGARMSAAANPKLPKAVKIAYLKRASLSKDMRERQQVAENPDCPADILERLATDPVTAMYVASNPNARIELLQALANTGDSGTRSRATANLAKRQETGP